MAEAPLSPEHAKALLGEISTKLSEHRKQLQFQVEQAVRSGLERLRLPTGANIKELGHRLEQLEAKLSRLESEKKGKHAG